MRYASIRDRDISNGTGIGVALFVQGCPYHCPGCFNQETWDFNGGKEWNENVENCFLDLASNEHISRISILGGEPFAFQNVTTVGNLITKIRQRFGDSRKIWVYTGNTIENLIKSDYLNMHELSMKILLSKIDVLVDGRFVSELQDLKLDYRGSSNQRIIDTVETMKEYGQTHELHVKTINSFQ
jgi:anaerobic ribonucleoside-triphosphate reductase activating protein